MWSPILGPLMIISSALRSFARWWRLLGVWVAPNLMWMPLLLHIMPFSRSFGPGRMMPSVIAGGRCCPYGPTLPLMWPCLAA